jgi:hypothetical protein
MDTLDHEPEPMATPAARQLRRALGNVLLACFGIGLALCAVEAVTRHFHLFPDRFWEPDPLLGTRLIPQMEGWWTQEDLEYRVPVRISGAGFRDVEHSMAKPANVFRILVLGDSFVEAMQVPLEHTLAREIERRVNRSRAAVRCEVISMGVSGYGTASELLLYRTRGRAYDPDLVLLAFYPGNDVRNNSPTLEPVLRPLYRSNGELSRVAADGKKQPAPRGVLASSQAYRYLRKLLLTRFPGLARVLVRAGVMHPEALRQAPMQDGVPVDYWVYATQRSEPWEHAWQHTERLLRELREAVEEDGARLALLLVAAREQVYPETWREIVNAYPAMQRLGWDLDEPERRVLRWCVENGVACVPLSEAFRARRSGPPLHYRRDGHWTADGHALAAEATVRFLREADMLPPGGTGATEERHARPNH